MMKRSSLTRISVFVFIALIYPSAMLAEEIPLIKKGGVYQIPVKINGVITLHFVLRIDTLCPQRL